MTLQHKLKGTVNYTVVGSPTIVEGVVSGFSSSDYLKTNSTFVDSGGDYECNISFTINEMSNNFVFSNRNNGLSFSYNGTKINWSLAPGVELPIADTIFQTGKKYTVNCSRSNGVYTLKIYTGNVLSETQTYQSNILLNNGNAYHFTFGYEGWSYGRPFKGSIDLNETYIKVNGQPWFGVCPVEVKKHQIKGPVGYTKVGSPTITNGVASGFGNTDYITTTQGISTHAVYDEDLEFVTKFTTGADITGAQYLCNQLGGGTPDTGGIHLYINNSYIRILVSTDGSNWNTSVPSGPVVSANTTYYIRVRYNKNTYDLTADLKTTGDWSNIISANLGALYGAAHVVNYGCGASFLNPFKGSIDLNETYIKVNGKLWYWQPQETKKMVVNGVQVWEKTV